MTATRKGFAGFAAIVFGVASWMAGGAAIAQAWPAKAIEVIVPFPPGAVDSRVRIVADKVSKILGKPLVIQNRPGAGFRIGTDALLRAPKDGYTIGVLAQANGAITPALDPNAGYDVRKDLTLLMLAYETPLIFVVHPSLGVNTIADFIKLAKRQPGKLNYGAAAGASAYRLWFEVFMTLAGINLQHIPYKGTAPALLDLAGGRTQAALGDAGVKPFVEAGKMVVLATTGGQRSPMYPNAPTVQESGVPFVAGTWLGFAAPSNLPRDVNQRLVEAFAEAIRSPEVRAAIEAGGGDVLLGLGPAEFQVRVDAEIQKFRRIGEQLNIKIE